ncbi:MAG TPA: RodZ domain-containing protein [Candidatus Saccharimonadales bacterium]|nr:RodZ domain-containing protein [Candidatus Saccharimonadales bacterium]
MKTVGQILSEERVKRNITLEEAEAATKIRKKILASLEAGDWKVLPSPTFAKGLIKNYGKFLGLDDKELMAFYRREVDERILGRKTVVSQQKKTRFRFTPQLVTVLAIVGFALIVFVYLFIQFQSFTGAPTLEVSEPKDNTKINSTEVNLVGKTWEDAILKVNGQQVQLSPGGTFSLPVSLNAGLNTITVTSENKFGKVSTIKRTVVVDNSVLQNQGEQQNVNLVVKALTNSVNLIVEEDGQKAFEGILVAGSEKSFSAKERIKVTTSDAGSTSVVFNEKEEVLGTLGQSGEKVYEAPSTPSL